MEFPKIIPECPAEYSFFKRLSRSPPLRLNDPEAYQYEYHRLASFAQWPEGLDLQFFDVAKSGLYRSGRGTEVSCFCCRVKFVVIVPRDDPVEIHKQKKPSCPLLQCTDTLNKPICSDSESDDENDSAEYFSYGADEPDSPANTASSSPLHGTTVSDGNSIDTFSSPVDLLSSRHISLEPDSATNNQPVFSLPHIGTTPGSDRMECGVANSMGDMFHEESRIETFRTWPTSANVSAVQLAQLGFFYTGEGDKAQCAFCHGILKKWERNDNIEAEHRKYFVTCPLVRGVERRNVPRPVPAAAASAPEQPLLRHAEASNTTTMTRRPMNSNTDSQAMHQSYCDYTARLASFNPKEGWHSKNVSPVSLAEAGFFFTGQADNVRCHFCDGGLRNWEPNDTPWVEHARWFPKCGFVLSEKGADFVAEMKARHPITPKPVPPPEEKTPPVDYALNLEYRKQALDMGFTDMQIKQAVEENLETEGHTFLNMHSLLEALLGKMDDRPPAREDPVMLDMHEEAPSAGAESTASAKKPSEDEKPSKSKKNKKKKKKDKQNSLEPAQTLAPSNDPTQLVIPEDDDESRSLHEENRQLKEQRMCKVCMDAEVNIVFLPCGHLVACSNCAPALRSCPICRALIRGSLRTYLS